MSEPLAKERPTVDLDDFERRLRQHDHSLDDPLAELARLVGEQADPYDDVFAQEAAAHQSRYVDPYPPQGRREPAFSTGFSPRLSGDFAAIEAGLRGAIPAHPEGPAGHQPAADYHPSADHEFYAQNEVYAQDMAYQHDQAYAPASPEQQWAPPHASPSAARSRRSVYAMAATIAVGVIGVGIAFAYKGTSSSPREIRTIMAAAGPSKIQPPAEATNDQNAQDAAILGANPQKTPTQLVSHEEQPVDLSQAVQNNTSRDADAGPSPGDAANVPVPPSPDQARQAASATPGAPQGTSAASADQMASFGMADMPAPKRVKVVSVRPDGTILSNDQPPAAALPTPHQPQTKANDKAAPVAEASTPHTAASTKTTSRIPAPKPTEMASAAGDAATGDAASTPKASARKAKAQRVASAETTPDATDSTASLPAAGGGFAVQLAAPASEADARSASSRFSKKFAEALAGRRIGFHKAQSNGKSVYRVRVGSLSREEAVSLCEKLKAAGGTCFVAKN